jgi:hypothetical protein
MNSRTSLFLLYASILYPLGLLIVSQTIISLQTYIILTPFYMYIVGWSAVKLEKKLEKHASVQRNN